MKHDSKGFTLAEIMIVTLIIGLLAAIAIPAFVKARRITQINTFANDLRILCDGINLVAMQPGGYPPDRSPGQPPTGLSNYVQHLDWSKPTPVGGLWDWDSLQWQFGGRAGISVYQPAWSAADMTEVDEKIDDGNLATGAFRQRAQGYIYLIEK